MYFTIVNIWTMHNDCWACVMVAIYSNELRAYVDEYLVYMHNVLSCMRM